MKLAFTRPLKDSLPGHTSIAAGDLWVLWAAGSSHPSSCDGALEMGMAHDVFHNSSQIKIENLASKEKEFTSLLPTVTKVDFMKGDGSSRPQSAVHPLGYVVEKVLLVLVLYCWCCCCYCCMLVLVLYCWCCWCY
jgi:hypothetical protein